MFYKFGDGTKPKTVIKKGNKDNFITKEEDQEIFDENDDTNRRSAIIKKYIEKEAEEKKE